MAKNKGGNNANDMKQTSGSNMMDMNNNQNQNRADNKKGTTSKTKGSGAQNFK